MSKKRFVAIIMAMCMCCSLLSGCSGNKAPAQSQGQSQATTTKPAEPEATKAKVLTLASTLTSSHSIVRVNKEMSEKVNADTEGAIDIQIYPDSTLGGQRDFLEGVAMGTVDMCLISASALEDFHEQFAIYSAPFVLRDPEHAQKFYDSEYGQKINEELITKTGMRPLGLFNEGYRDIWTKENPVHTVADLKGLKLRVPEVTLYINTFTALGANTTAVAFGDLYTALQTGLVDGYELPITAVYTSSLHEPVKYCTITQHIGGAYVLLVNEGKWQSLTAEQQDCVLKYVAEAAAQDRLNLETDSAENRKVIEESGVEFIEMTPEAHQEMVDMMGSVLDELYGDVFSDEMLDAVRAM